jgi:hypothetical protein
MNMTSIRELNDAALDTVTGGGSPAISPGVLTGAELAKLMSGKIWHGPVFTTGTGPTIPTEPVGSIVVWAEGEEMNVISIRELNGAELEAIVGGMDCQTALVVSSIYDLTADALSALGNTEGATYNAGKAAGVRIGACGRAGPFPNWTKSEPP